jgi:hypothetical protein
VHVLESAEHATCAEQARPAGNQAFPGVFERVAHRPGYARGVQLPMFDSASLPATLVPTVQIVFSLLAHRKRDEGPFPGGPARLSARAHTRVIFAHLPQLCTPLHAICARRRSYDQASAGRRAATAAATPITMAASLAAYPSWRAWVPWQPLRPRRTMARTLLPLCAHQSPPTASLRPPVTSGAKPSSARGRRRRQRQLPGSMAEWHAGDDSGAPRLSVGPPLAAPPPAHGSRRYRLQAKSRWCWSCVFLTAAQVAQPVPTNC